LYSKTGLYLDIVNKFADTPTGNITAAELRAVTSGIVALMVTGAGNSREVQLNGGSEGESIASPNLLFSTGNVLTISTGSISIGASNPIGLDFNIGTGGLPAAVSITSLRGAATTGIYVLSDSTNPFVLDGGPNGKLRVQLGSMNVFYESAQQHHFYSAANGHLITLTSSTIEPSLNLPYNIGLATRRFGTGYFKTLSLGTGGDGNTILLNTSNNLTGSYTLTLPTGQGISGQVLSTDGAGITRWVSQSGGGGSPGGSNRQIQFNDNGAFGGLTGFELTANSGLMVPGSGSFEGRLTVSGILLVNSAIFLMRGRALDLFDDDNSFAVVFKAPAALDQTYEFILPTTGGLPGQVLGYVSAGQTRWVNQSGGSGTPAGGERNIQFNNGGSFGAMTGFVVTTSTGIVVPGSGYFGNSIWLKSQTTGLSNPTSHGGVNFGTTGTNWVGLRAAGDSSSYVIILPNDNGLVGQALVRENSEAGISQLNWRSIPQASGTDRSIQFNNGGQFAGSTGLLFTADSGLVVAGTGNFGDDVWIQNYNGIVFNNDTSFQNEGLTYLRAGFNPVSGTINITLPETQSQAGQVLTAIDNFGTLAWITLTGASGITPGGFNRSIQFNNAGNFDGSNGFQLTTETGLIVRGSGSFGNSLSLYNNAGLILYELTVNGTDSITIKSPDTLNAPYTLTLPPNNGNNGQVLQTDGDGVTSWVNPSGAGGGDTSPGGSDRYIQFNDNSSFGGVAGFLLTTSTGLVVSNTGSFGGNVTFYNAKGLILSELTSNGTSTITLKAPDSLDTSYTFTLPSNDGAANQILSTDGNGVTSWVNQTGAGGGSTNPAGTDRQVQYNDNNAFGASSSLIFTHAGGLVVGASGSYAGNLKLYDNNSLVLAESTSNGTNTISLKGPSNLTTSYSFTLPSDGGSVGQVLRTDGNGNTSWVNQTGGGGSTTPGGSTRQVQFNDGGAFGGSAGLVYTSNQGLAVGTSGSFGGDLTLYGHSSLILYDDSTSTIEIVAPSSVTSYTLTLPQNDGSAGQVLRTDGNGVTSWVNQTGGGGSTTPGGANRQVQFNDAGAFGGNSNLVLTSNGGIEVGGSGSFSSDIYLLNNAGLILRELTSNGASSVTIKAPSSLSSSYDFILPSDDGTNGQVLVTDGAGTTSWRSTGNNPIPGGVDRSVQYNNNGVLGGTTAFAFTSNQGLTVPGSGSFGSNLSIQGNNGLILTDNGAGKITIVAPTSVTTYVLTLPDSDGTAGQFLRTDGAGTTSWANTTGGGGSTSPAGSNRQIQYNDNGSFGATSNFTLTSNDGLVVGGSGSFSDDITIHSQNGIIFNDSDNSHNIKLIAPATVPTSITFTLPDNDGSAGQILRTDGGGTLSWVNQTGGGGGTSPGGADTQVQYNNAGAFGGSSSFRFANNGIIVGGSGSFDTDVHVRGGLKLYDGGSDTVTISSPSLSTSYSLTLPTTNGNAGEVLVTDGNGVLSWAHSGGAGGATSPGGSNRQIQFNNAGAFGGSANCIFTSSNEFIVTGSIRVKGQVYLLNGNQSEGLNLYYDNNAVKVIAPSSVANWTLTLPTDGGSVGQVLRTDGNGTTSWVSNALPITQSPSSHLMVNTRVVTLGGPVREAALMEYEVPSGLFEIDGDYIEFEAFGTYAKGNGIRHIAFYYGDSKISVGPIVQNGGSWRLNGLIIRQSDDSQLVQCTYIPSFGSNIGTVCNVIDAEQPYGSGVIRVTYSGIPSVTQKFMSCKWNPKL
jgi:hypothetical protein